MPALTRRSLAVACLLLVLGGNGCGGGSDSSANTGPVTSVVKRTGDLQLVVSTPKSVYARGETVPITFTITNTGSQNVSVTYDCAVDNYTVMGNGETVFLGLNACAGGSAIVITPGQSVVKQVMWEQTDQNHQPVAAGRYALAGYIPIRLLNDVNLIMSLPPNQWFAYRQANYGSNPVTITIR